MFVSYVFLVSICLCHVVGQDNDNNVPLTIGKLRMYYTYYVKRILCLLYFCERKNYIINFCRSRILLYYYSGLVRQPKQHWTTDFRIGRPKSEHRPNVFKRIFKSWNKNGRFHGHLHDRRKRYTNIYENSPSIPKFLFFYTLSFCLFRYTYV